MTTLQDRPRQTQSDDNPTGHIQQPYRTHTKTDDNINTTPDKEMTTLQDTDQDRNDNPTGHRPRQTQSDDNPTGHIDNNRQTKRNTTLQTQTDRHKVMTTLQGTYNKT